MVDELNRQLEQDFPNARLGWSDSRPPAGSLLGAGTAMKGAPIGAGSTRPPGMVEQVAGVLADLDALEKMLADLSVRWTGHCPPVDVNAAPPNGPDKAVPGIIPTIHALTGRMSKAVNTCGQIVDHIREAAS